MTNKELMIKKTKGVVRALRFYSKVDVWVTFNVPRWWFDEVSKGLVHFEHWFDQEVPGYLSVYFPMRQYDPSQYRFTIEGNGAVLRPFFDKYDHIFNELSIYQQ